MCQQDHKTSVQVQGPKSNVLSQVRVRIRKFLACHEELDVGLWTWDFGLSSESPMLLEYFNSAFQRKGFNGMAAASRCRGAKEGIVDGLFGCFDDGEKQWRHRIVRQDREIAGQVWLCRIAGSLDTKFGRS
jgi:hypothetical protein